MRAKFQTAQNTTTYGELRRGEVFVWARDENSDPYPKMKTDRGHVCLQGITYAQSHGEPLVIRLTPVAVEDDTIIFTQLR